MSEAFLRSDSQQALAAMNSRFMIDCAARFAERVVKSAGETFADRLGFAYQLAYGRAPAPEEFDLFWRFLEPARQAGDSGVASKAWRTVCQALLSSSEFIYVD